MNYFFTLQSKFGMDAKCEMRERQLREERRGWDDIGEKRRMNDEKHEKVGRRRTEVVYVGLCHRYARHFLLSFLVAAAKCKAEEVLRLLVRA